METLRLWPALANGTFRVLENDDYITTKNKKKIHIPKGTRIQIPIWSRHRSKQLWGADSEIFNPDREFIEDELWNNTVINSYNPSSERFSPFIYGPRDCIGKNFSQIEMRIILLYIIREFEFTLTDEQNNIKDRDNLGFNIFTFGPRNIKNNNLTDNTIGMWVNIKKRNKKYKL